MKTLLIAAATSLLAISAIPATALTPQQHQQQQPAGRANDRAGNQSDNRGNTGDSRYGQWDARWGARPATPPRSFTRTSDWYRHVHACQARYRSYNPRTDSYVPSRGRTAICRL